MILLNRPQHQAWCGFISKVLVNTGVWSAGSLKTLQLVMFAEGLIMRIQECGPFAALVKQCPLTLKCEATQACQVFVINMNGAIIRR